MALNPHTVEKIKMRNKMDAKKVGRGGKRPNAGRKTLDDIKKKKQTNYYLTNEEKIKMDEFLKTIRA
jgi:hypothetical protein